MLKSMTGSGRVKVENAYREILVEVRSVNNRYLDCNVKMPQNLQLCRGSCETACKRICYPR